MTDHTHTGRADIAEAATSNPDERFIGFEMPFGWFSVGHSDEFVDGSIASRRLCDTELIVWRDQSGSPVVQDSYCAHLGANLAVGGTIDEVESTSCVRCPFHGWAFGSDGRNVEVPYDERTNGKARIRTYPSIESNGFVLFWWHPDPSVEPMWDIPTIDVLEGASYDVRQAWTVEAPWQEFSENGSDTAHFAYVHGSPRVATMEEADYSTPVRRMLVSNRYPTKRGVIDGTQETVTYGPGLGITHFSIGDADMYLVATQAPLSPTRTVARFAWHYGDSTISQKMGPSFAAEVERQFHQDLPIWNHKRHIARPALAINDGPIPAYRTWARQFYAGQS